MALLLEHPERLVVVTGNLDLRVQPFLDRHGLAGMTSTVLTHPHGTAIYRLLRQAAPAPGTVIVKNP
jgi:hypothetical protein